MQQLLLKIQGALVVETTVPCALSIAMPCIVNSLVILHDIVEILNVSIKVRKWAINADKPHAA